MSRSPDQPDRIGPRLQGAGSPEGMRKLTPDEAEEMVQKLKGAFEKVMGVDIDFLLDEEDVPESEVADAVEELRAILEERVASASEKSGTALEQSVPDSLPELLATTGMLPTGPLSPDDPGIQFTEANLGAQVLTMELKKDEALHQYIRDELADATQDTEIGQLLVNATGVKGEAAALIEYVLAKRPPQEAQGLIGKLSREGTGSVAPAVRFLRQLYKAFADKFDQLPDSFTLKIKDFRARPVKVVDRDDNTRWQIRLMLERWGGKRPGRDQQQYRCPPAVGASILRGLAASLWAMDDKETWSSCQKDIMKTHRYLTEILNKIAPPDDRGGYEGD